MSGRTISSRFRSAMAIWVVLATLPGAMAEEKGGSNVQSLNGLKGKLTLAAGVGTSITKTDSKTITITGLALPYTGSVTSVLTPFTLVNTIPAGWSGATMRSEIDGNAGTAIEAIDNTTLSSGLGVWAYSSTGTAATFWGNSFGTGAAGYFYGNVAISGTLSKGGGSFKIDHPLDPKNKYLYHSFVESPDMMNIYDGNIELDERGEAIVELPEWFDALNRDFRYQLTCIGGFAPVFIQEEITANRFKIGGGQPGLKISWQVTGIRKDPFANAHRIPVEENKQPDEQGYYLHPDAYGQPPERGIEWARHPELVRRVPSQQR